MRTVLTNAPWQIVVFSLGMYLVVYGLRNAGLTGYVTAALDWCRQYGVWGAAMGCEVIDAGILPDDLEKTRAALGGLRDVDLILSTGGVSVGEADFLGHALREEGEIALWKLAIKPGKPLTFGHFRGVPVIGLPGNPASTLVTFALLARPYLLRRLGVQQVEPLRFKVPSGFVWGKPGMRREYLRGLIDQY